MLKVTFFELISRNIFLLCFCGRVNFCFHCDAEILANVGNTGFESLFFLLDNIISNTVLNRSKLFWWFSQETFSFSFLKRRREVQEEFFFSLSKLLKLNGRSLPFYNGNGILLMIVKLISYYEITATWKLQKFLCNFNDQFLHRMLFSRLFFQ